MRKRIALFFGMCVTVLSVWAQENLVINPSFEMDSCLVFWRGGGYWTISGWDTLRNGGGGTPDLFNECYVPSNKEYWVPININSKGYQYPKSGNGYVGMAVTNLADGTSVREYVQGKLTHKLLLGHSYCVEIYVSLYNACKFSCKSIGVFFDDGQVSTVHYQLPNPNVTPQILNTTQLDDTLNWMLIKGRFIANGTEEYITIGNFFPDSLSSVEMFNLSASYSSAYYYIDDVSVIEISDVYAGNDTTIYAGDSVFLGKAGVDGALYTWHSNGAIIDSTAGLWVKPDSTTTYILQQNICSSVSYDTVTVTVDFGSGIVPVAGEAKIKVYPNPTVSHVRFSEFANIQLYSITGQLMIEKENINALDVSVFSSGVYVLVFEDKKGEVIQRSRVVKQ